MLHYNFWLGSMIYLEHSQIEYKPLIRVYCRVNFLEADIYFRQLKFQTVRQLKAYDIAKLFGTYNKMHLQLKP